MRLNDLPDLYVDNLRDLYSAEHQMLEALPKMAEAASSPQVRSAFTEHIEQTKRQVQRLDRVSELVGTSLSGKQCKGVEGLVEEGAEQTINPQAAQT